MSITLTPGSRYSSIDLLRGIIMVIMALDHTRDFVHEDAVTGNPLDLATTTPILFFTRWITHYCAPLFVFLAGLSAYLAGRKRPVAAHSKFLITRGLWLILVEIVIMTFIFTLDPGYHVFFLAIIWAIGWSMLLMGLLLRGGWRIMLAIGLIIFFGHNITNLINLSNDGVGGALRNVFLTTPGALVPLPGGRNVLLAYTILPWTAVMLLGYCAGRFYEMDVQRRQRWLVSLGSGAVLFFVLMRFINIYGDPAPWKEQSSWFYTFLSFINTTKYPPSLLFLCMTLGPGLLLLALFEGRTNAFLSVYGRVPFFYYVLHFALIRLISVVMFFSSGYTMDDVKGFPFYFRPEAMGGPLESVYLVWIGVVLMLFLPCRWYDRYKQQHKEKRWLSYL
ncbi:heparan-alpha-glucosaminide N-acetyltransferase domain-containing protein [Chitinophaga horti]|uniref:Heparan-alpha-glucosaminide N-acetyltransferase domain-containing protein n=1 Tax=Chitinophaga horti TaxID=2920382 RepID=A0ABY6J2Y2_9BACT|nr:heparan-alpha-glucosaminide N-acetyltransferase domain-containing protein [Chitinophaga horti]UYQ94023.1 heparan-alpha-glucosaminide N-acetyltransferase domain-containing protein [Chitinophaga horti]